MPQVLSVSSSWEPGTLGQLALALSGKGDLWASLPHPRDQRLFSLTLSLCAHSWGDVGLLQGKAACGARLYRGLGQTWLSWVIGLEVW